MVNPITSVNVKSALTVELTIMPTSGKPSKFLISEGCKFTNLRYISGGKEVVASGVCKVIKWNFINLPDTKDCVHSAVSRFNSQCLPTSLIVDCSSEFSSDIREISISAIRACEKIETADGGEVTPNPPVDDTPMDGVLARVTITGDVDPDTGVLTDAVVSVTLTDEVASGDTDEFLTTSAITITNTPVDAISLAELNIEWASSNQFSFNIGELGTIDLVVLKENGSVATLVSGDTTSDYDLTEDDFPEWAPPSTVDPTPDDTEVTLVSASAMNDELTIVLSGAKTDPKAVILNNSTVLDKPVVSDDENGNKTCVIPISGNKLKSTGNIVYVYGSDYALESEPFDGFVATVVSVDELTNALTDAFDAVYKSVDNVPKDELGIEEYFNATMMRVLTEIPADETVKGISLNGTTYDIEEAVEWTLNEQTFHCSLAVVENGNVSLCAMGLVKYANSNGTVDVSVVTEKVAVSRSVDANGTYHIGEVTLTSTSPLTLASVSVANTDDNFDATVTKNDSDVELNRESLTAQAVVVLNDTDGNALKDNSVAFVVSKEGNDTEIFVVKVNSGVMVPSYDLDSVTKDVIVIAEKGVANFTLIINKTVRPSLNVTNMVIKGTVDESDSAANYSISFEVVPTTLTKEKIATGHLKVYGTELDGTLGELFESVEIVDGTVTATASTSATLDVSNIKNGTIASLAIGGETAIVEDVSVTSQEEVV